ncbi:hypothetical protein FG379_001646 [Cryptosporidium bovis]|uniref:uncharacterized protein n=1 Tax=Cryptosporidium bovis TaxID=310047 RepID=UPI003519FBFD|nr:hypothetical protein FG379_001646 [Cryptosporidium bovis]
MTTISNSDNNSNNNEQRKNVRNNDIWNLYGLIDPEPLSSAESDDINYVSMVAIGAATSAALWKAHFYRPEEMDDFTTYSMYIITFLTVVGGVYVIYSIRKREKQSKNAVKGEVNEEGGDCKREVCNLNKNNSTKKGSDTNEELSSNTTDDNTNKSGNTMRRRKNRVD